MELKKVIVTAEIVNGEVICKTCSCYHKNAWWRRTVEGSFKKWAQEHDKLQSGYYEAPGYQVYEEDK